MSPVKDVIDCYGNKINMNDVGLEFVPILDKLKVEKTRLDEEILIREVQLERLKERQIKVLSLIKIELDKKCGVVR